MFCFLPTIPTSASAKTRIFYNRKGLITEADIVFNPFQQFSTDGTFGTFDLESTLTHEIGHLLGLHHSAVLGSTMADSFASNGTRGFVDFGPRTLADSDIAAIRDLYGPKPGDEECCAVISGKISIERRAGPSQGLEFGPRMVRPAVLSLRLIPLPTECIDWGPCCR